MKYVCLLLVVTLLTTKTSAIPKINDTTYIEVGKTMPYFELDGIGDFARSRASLDDFKGKWLVIDFWNKLCISCIESLPKINSLQKKYKNDLQYLLIGREDDNNGIRKIYAKFRKSLNLQIAYAFDSSLFQRFDINICPRIIVVDPKGVVYAYTNSLNDKDIADILAGRVPQLNKIYQANESRPPKYKLSDSDNNSDSSLLFKSAFNRWNPSLIGNNERNLNPQNGYYEAIGRNINDLYMLAYFGLTRIIMQDSLYTIVSQRALFETSDKQKLEESLEKVFYCYRLTMPSDQNSKNSVMRIMQHDLNSYFGYDVAIEERMMPYWKLTASKKAREKLKTKGEKKMYQGRIDTGFVAKNFSMKEIISRLVYADLPILDKTGITGNIDISLSHLLTTPEEIQKGMKENGLSLVKSRKKMKVLVIRDPVPFRTL